VLFFEFFPAFIALVSLVVGTWLYVANRRAPDESGENAQRLRERDARAAAALREGAVKDPRPRRPSMRQ
jgi:hypothetical protein